MTCKVVILKKAIAETSILNGGWKYCDYLLKWHHGVKVLPRDYPIYMYICIYIYIIYYINILYIDICTFMYIYVHKHAYTSTSTHI